ncbi:MAG: hypothetical protein GY940_05860 [bacterium]|nr:hypothetical protein [bacterium]
MDKHYELLMEEGFTLPILLVTSEEDLKAICEEWQFSLSERIRLVNGLAVQKVAQQNIADAGGDTLGTSAQGEAEEDGDGLASGGGTGATGANQNAMAMAGLGGMPGMGTGPPPPFTTSVNSEQMQRMMGFAMGGDLPPAPQMPAGVGMGEMLSEGGPSGEGGGGMSAALAMAAEGPMVTGGGGYIQQDDFEE